MDANVNLIWFKGAIRPRNECLINVLSPSAQFGLSVFEGVRCYYNNDTQKLYAFRLECHIKRLSESCKLIGIPFEFTIEQIRLYIKDVVQENTLMEDIAVRITLFIDEEGTWSSCIKPELFIAPVKKNRKIIESITGQKACITSWQRISDNILPPRIKAGANYINSRYAMLQAINDGYDTPIFMGIDGKISEGPGSCLFIVRDSVLITPTVSQSILESITRDTIITIARDVLKLDVIERAVDRTEVYLADEVFLCGTAAEITPIVVVDRFVIGSGLPGILSLKLLQCYHKAVTQSLEGYESWAESIL